MFSHNYEQVETGFFLTTKTEELKLIHTTRYLSSGFFLLLNMLFTRNVLMKICAK